MVSIQAISSLIIHVDRCRGGMELNLVGCIGVIEILADAIWFCLVDVYHDEMLKAQPL